MADTKYFRYAFSSQIEGSRKPIPGDIQPNGTMSYASGFPVGYSTDPMSAGSLSPLRTQYNQLHYDITLFAKQVQEYATPNFINANQNANVNFPYDQYAQVFYSDNIYTSLVDNNDTLPTSDNWVLTDDFGQFITLNHVEFAPDVEGGDVVYYDGVFRRAIANGGPENVAVGLANVAESRVILSGSRPWGSTIPGIIYYLSSVTPGGITRIPPYPYVTQIAIGLSTSQRKINIQQIATPFSYLPIGAVISSASPIGISDDFPVPDGWLLCGDTPVSRITYAQLFSVIGTLWGVGNGTTTFSLPPNGYFTRPWNSISRGVDFGRQFGWEGRQTDEYGLHNHGLASSDITTDENWYFLGNQQSGLAGSFMARVNGDNFFATGYYDIDTAQGKLVQLTGGDETRPANVAMAQLIKYM